MKLFLGEDDKGHSVDEADAERRAHVKTYLLNGMGTFTSSDLRRCEKWRWWRFSKIMNWHDRDLAERFKVRKALTPMTPLEVAALAEWVPSRDGEWTPFLERFVPPRRKTHWGTRKLQPTK